MESFFQSVRAAKSSADKCTLPSVAYDLPKPGGVTKGKLHATKFPGLTVSYTTDGSNPTTSSPVYTVPVVIGPEDKVTLRSFDANGRGGRSIQVDQ